MARSLTVTHEEDVSTSMLLNGFLLFALACMMISALSWSVEAGAEATGAASTDGPVEALVD